MTGKSRASLGTYSIVLASILWGTLLGGITYSHLVFFPVYLADLFPSAAVVAGPYALEDVRFWGLVQGFAGLQRSH